MSIQVRFMRAQLGERPSAVGSAGMTIQRRLIPMALALYLSPAVLVVLLVGGLSLLILAVARTITLIFDGPEAWPRDPAGPGSSSS